MVGFILDSTERNAREAERQMLATLVERSPDLIFGIMLPTVMNSGAVQEGSCCQVDLPETATPSHVSGVLLVTLIWPASSAFLILLATALAVISES